MKDEGAQRYAVWTPNAVGPWTTSDITKAQLVACFDVVKATKLRDCHIDASHVLERYAATIKVTTYEAKTGKKLDEHTVDQREDGCPSSAWMNGTKQRDYGDMGIFLVRQVASLQPADAPPPSIPAWQLSDACLGKPALGAAAYVPAKGAANAFVVFRREGTAPFDSVETAEAIYGHQEWFDRNLKASSGQDEQVRTSLTVCMTATRGKKAKDCPFSGGKSLAVFDGTWNVDLVDPMTGKALASRTFRGAASCPDSWAFGRGNELTAEPGRAFVAFLEGFVTPK